ncbi:hypothetical protein RSAG8_11764, partial [Rhizoctonia solani AG-8 WAC10335]
MASPGGPRRRVEMPCSTDRGGGALRTARRGIYKRLSTRSQGYPIRTVRSKIWVH